MAVLAGGVDITPGLNGDVVQVACYSGRTYADRPVSFIWEDVELRVKEVEREWQEPGERHFRVRTDDDRTFELCYYEGGNGWTAVEWVLNRDKGGRDE